MKKEIRETLANAVCKLMIERTKLLSEKENNNKKTSFPEEKCLEELDKIIDNMLICLKTNP